MKVGVNTATELKSVSVERDIPFADLLHGYMVEDVLRRIQDSSYREHLWFAQKEGIMLDEIALHTEEKINFFYIKALRIPSAEKLVAGQVLSDELVNLMLKEIFGEKNANGVVWSCDYLEKDGIYTLQLLGEYREMQVPVNISIETLQEENARAVKYEIPMILKPNKCVSYYSYAPENLMGEHVFEIVRKLELIGDMKSYSVVNDILRTQSVSGRHIMEELYKFAEKEPKVVKPKRMEQIAGYREYTYMRKRWEQYCKYNGKELEPWSEVLDRILNFLQPLWNCLCSDEIFFDDWMPELGRFLG